MKLFGPARLDLEDRLLLDAALDEAFAPLRARSAHVSAARVRATVRWTRPDPRAVHGFALLNRIGELSVAAAVSALLFGASLASLTPAAAGDGLADVSRDAVSAGQWTLNGRLAFQRPINSHTADYRMTAGELATNAAAARREAMQSDRLTGSASTNH
jgi:hypothetical protein